MTTKDSEHLELDGLQQYMNDKLKEIVPGKLGEYLIWQFGEDFWTMRLMDIEDRLWGEGWRSAFDDVQAAAKKGLTNKELLKYIRLNR